MNLFVLTDKAELTAKAMLYIEPLAPLSLVTSMPGAYYRSQREPSDFMIYGMLENLLGWHFTNDIRNKIIKELIKYHKKNYQLPLTFYKTEVGYVPLIQNHIKIVQYKLKPHIEAYDDYWTQHLIDVDNRHLKGVRQYDFSLNKEIARIKLIDNDKQQNAELDKIMKYKNGLVPTYYQSPTKREFLHIEGKFGFILQLTDNILKLLTIASELKKVPVYLGTNEGWVNIVIGEL